MAALSRLSLLLSVHLIWRLDDAMVGDVERTAGWPRAKRRSPREVHEAARATKQGQVRGSHSKNFYTRLPCGFWPAVSILIRVSVISITRRTAGGVSVVSYIY